MNIFMLSFTLLKLFKTKDKPAETEAVCFFFVILWWMTGGEKERNIHVAKYKLMKSLKR